MFLARKDLYGNTQTLKEHIENTAKLAAAWGAEIGFEHLMACAGLVHDCGKYSEAFQEYLFDENASRGSVVHTLAGVQYVEQIFEEIYETHAKWDYYTLLARDILIYVVGGHHGVFDPLSLEGISGISNKIKASLDEERSHASESIKKYEREFNKEKLIGHLKEGIFEVKTFITRTIEIEPTSQEIEYTIGNLVRVLLSILMDADWSDARKFQNPTIEEFGIEADNVFWTSYSNCFEANLTNLKEKNRIDIFRKKISKECLDASNLKPGIYRLNVPTGGGKTLASLRFALHHAQRYKKKRIFYIAPYMSILEQNTKAFRNILGLGTTDSKKPEIIFEHHSNIFIPIEEVEEQIRYDYLSVTWEVPIILTTMVQLLNTLFSASKEAMVRTHKLIDSIILIDEIQALPMKCVSMFNLMANDLVKHFGCTIVLASATQTPLNEEIESQTGLSIMGKLDVAVPENLVNDYGKESVFANRIEIIDKTKQAPYTAEEIACLIKERFDDMQSLLVVLNTRNAVDTIYEFLRDCYETDEIMVLSNNMVPAHRLETIEALQERLNKKQKTLCISTQLIEAGVDLSFEGAIRSMSGLDSVIQTAGRCNRHGELERGKVWIANCDTKLENLDMLKDIKIAQEQFWPILNEFRKKPDEYDHSFLSAVAINKYYLNYFKAQCDESFFRVPVDGKMHSLFRMLSDNSEGIKAAKSKELERFQNLNQAFKTAYEKFECIISHETGVLVPWREGEEIINRLLSEQVDAKVQYRLLQEAQRYSAGISNYRIDELIKTGDLDQVLDGRVYILKKELYDEKRGVIREAKKMDTVTDV